MLNFFSVTPLLTGLMHGLKVKYMMHINVETEAYYFVLPSE